MSQTNILLKSILEELIKLNQREREPYFREWYPLAFHVYQQGFQIHDRYIGASKWGFKQIWTDDPLYYDFDYEFHSLQLHTENRNYKPALKLVINGKTYPENERFASSDGAAPYVHHRIFTGHNYNYQRCYQFSDEESYQSNMGKAKYPFKMVVKAEPKWALNFEYFSASTSWHWSYIIINGWKLYKEKEEKIDDLQNIVDTLQIEVKK